MAKPKGTSETEFFAIDDVAALLFVDERTIRNWINAKGMPSVKDERSRRFIWFDVLPWYVKMRAEEDGNRRKSSAPAGHLPFPQPDGEDLQEGIVQAQLRLTVAQADIAELNLAVRRGQVVAIEDVAKTLTDVAASLKQEILGWPTVMIGRIFGMRDRSQLFNTLTESARELCTRLAALGPAEPAAGEDPDA